jgi:hypothetical protein
MRGRIARGSTEEGSTARVIGERRPPIEGLYPQGRRALAIRPIKPPPRRSKGNPGFLHTNEGNLWVGQRVSDKTDRAIGEVLSWSEGAGYQARA